MKRKMSVTTRITLQSLVCGLLWMLAGVGSVIHTVPALIMSVVFLVAALIIFALIGLSVNESGDEMSQLNLYKAKSRTFNIVLYGLIAFSTIVAIQEIRGIEIVLNWRGWIMIFIGIMQFISGFLFRMYEKGIDVLEE